MGPRKREASGLLANRPLGLCPGAWLQQIAHCVILGKVLDRRAQYLAGLVAFVERPINASQEPIKFRIIRNPSKTFP